MLKKNRSPLIKITIVVCVCKGGIFFCLQILDNYSLRCCCWRGCDNGCSWGRFLGYYNSRDNSGYSNRSSYNRSGCSNCFNCCCACFGLWSVHSSGSSFLRLGFCSFQCFSSSGCSFSFINCSLK